MTHPRTDKSITQALQKSAIKFRTIFESANDGILILQGATVVDCNQQILKMFECDRDEIIGLSPSDWSPLLQAEGITSSDKMREKLTAVQQGQSESFEWVHLRKDGSVFNAEISLYCIGPTPNNQLIAILRDITDRTRIQADLQSNNAKLKAAHIELISLYQQLAASEEVLGQQLEELKASEKKLEFSEQRYRLAMDASNDAKVHCNHL